MLRCAVVAVVVDLEWCDKGRGGVVIIIVTTSFWAETDQAAYHDIMETPTNPTRKQCRRLLDSLLVLFQRWGWPLD